jgi:Lrp/AsnC family leucine-responsive transcriptional regulator
MVDTIDLKIITQLEINSRASYVEIGKQIGLSPSSVREQFKIRRYSVIRGYKVQLNNQELGFGLEVFILFKLLAVNYSCFVIS